MKLTENKSMWSSYDDIISKSKEGKKIITKFITSVIMIAVKYSSMQRPGAVINCLVKEYQDAIMECGVNIIIKYRTTKLVPMEQQN